MARVNYKNDILKKNIIPKLKEDVKYLKDNVIYDYPKAEPSFPLVVCNISETPYAWDIGQNEIVTNITVRLSVLSDTMSSCMDLEYDVTTSMLDMGYTRLEPTEPYKNEDYGMFQIDIRYKIRYNVLTGYFEKSL